MRVSSSPPFARTPPGPRATAPAETLQRRLLAWYDGARRTLPWRAAPGHHADPYRVWVSEIMLQQTTVAVAAPYFQRFLARWPRVEDLAAADLDEVLHAWQGLGYYARARNMHACARAVAAAGGRFPDTEETLRALPGIGAYTAAAIAAIAFGRRAAPVDGNVVRVLARLDAVDAAMPAARAVAASRARALMPEKAAGDFAQALMDLGATICTPRRPRCDACPWRGLCSAQASGRPEDFPRKASKKERPERHGAAFWIERAGHVFLRKRPSGGLLGDMMEIPSTDWRPQPWTTAEAAASAPLVFAPGTAWRRVPGTVRHVFTHFSLEMTVIAGRPADEIAPADGQADGRWCRIDELDAYALPTLMKKIARHALDHPASERGHPKARH